MMHLVKILPRTVILALATLFIMPCAAETGASPKEYVVELLIFQNLIAGDGGEVWPIDYSEWFEETLEEGPLPEAEPIPLTWLGKDTHRLSAQRNALRVSAQYRPLAHVAWRQPVLDRRQAKSIQLPVDENTAAASYVDGSVRVAVERYLHLYLDLQLHTLDSYNDPDLLEFETPEFRLKEHRRMRSKEVHYFDHPRFGVIALITPYEAPQEAPAAAVEPSVPEQPQ
jgi:hypothetical protein